MKELGMTVVFLVAFAIPIAVVAIRDSNPNVIRRREQKRLERNQEEKKRYREEQNRLIAVRVKNEKIAFDKEQKKRARDEKRLQTVENIGKTIGETIYSAKKMATDSTQKLRNRVNLDISKHYLTSFSWVLVGTGSEQIIYTFKDNFELLITVNGIVERETYEILGQNNSILISKGDTTIHYNFINIENNYFFLNKISTTDVIAFVNQSALRDLEKEWFISESNKLKSIL